MQDNKKIFIEIPTWLGDAVMITPAIENIVKANPDCELTIFGSYVSAELFKYHPNVKNIIIDDSKKSGNRYINLYKLAKKVGRVDIALSFRRNFTTKFLLWFIDAKQKFRYKRYAKRQRHQVLRYNDFINKNLFFGLKSGNLKIYKKENVAIKNKKPILGINPGATYGSAKRWYSQEFAKVAIKLASKYDIKIFGSNNETKMANEIEKLLQESNIKNYQNLAGKTTVDELIEDISSLNLFITNDSGPMHIAAAFSVPTVTIFGSTKYKETKQWNNDNSMIIRKDFECMPCMKRECPLKGEENHQCMKAVTAQDVLDKIYADVESEKIKKKKLKSDFLKKYNLDKNIKLVLFKANNFKQNGIHEFIEIVSKMQSTNFKAIVCGDDEQLKYTKKEAKDDNCEDKIIFINSVHLKICDIFVLPTHNKTFAKNVLKAMENKCAVFAPRTNDANALLDSYATMSSYSDPNTPHKIDALLRSNDDLKLIQEQNKQKATFWKNK